MEGRGQGETALADEQIVVVELRNMGTLSISSMVAMDQNFGRTH